MQFIVALNFAELSSHFPVAGSVYQWTKYLANRGYAWITGWFYLFAGILTVASVCATLPLALLPMLNNMFDWNLNTDFRQGRLDQRIAALVTLTLITILNIYGVKVVAIVNNTGRVLRDPRDGRVRDLPRDRPQQPGPRRDLRRRQGGNIFAFPAPFRVQFFLVGMFMSLYVIYGFDTASTLGGGDAQPETGAPKAVIASGDRVVHHRRGLPVGRADRGPGHGRGGRRSFATDDEQVIEVASRNVRQVLYLFVVVAAIFVCCMAIQTSTIRLAFGMARDNQLPFSKTMAKVNPRLHTPSRPASSSDCSRRSRSSSSRGRARSRSEPPHRSTSATSSGTLRSCARGRGDGLGRRRPSPWAAGARS